MAVLKNQRHEIVAQGIASGLSWTDAVISAGYSEKTAPRNSGRMKNNDEIRSRIDELQGRAAKSVSLSKEWVIEKLIAVHNSAIEGNPVLDRYGHPTGKTIVNHSGANKSLELLGKEIGMFVERKDITHRRLTDMSRTELEAELAELESGETRTHQTRH